MRFLASIWANGFPAAAARREDPGAGDGHNGDEVALAVLEHLGDGRDPGAEAEDPSAHRRDEYVLPRSHFTIAGGWAYLGPVGNHFADCAWGVQLKYEF